MKSKSGNKLKKIRGVALGIGIALTGCLMSPHETHVDHVIDARCMDQPDSTTWTDTAYTDHYSCTIGGGK